MHFISGVDGCRELQEGDLACGWSVGMAYRMAYIASLIEIETFNIASMKILIYHTCAGRLQAGGRCCASFVILSVIILED